MEKIPWVVQTGPGARRGAGGLWRSLACSRGSGPSQHGQMLGTARAQSLRDLSSVPPCPPRLLSSPCQSPLGPGLSTVLSPRYSIFLIRRRLWAPFFLHPSLRTAVCPPDAGEAGGTRPWTGRRGRQAPRPQSLHVQLILPSQSSSMEFPGLPGHPLPSPWTFSS